MNKINELKKRLDELEQEKSSNNKLIDELNQNDVGVIETDIKNLKTLVTKIKKSKVLGLVGSISSVIGFALTFSSFGLMLSSSNSSILDVIAQYFFSGFSHAKFMVNSLIIVSFGVGAVLSTIGIKQFRDSRDFLHLHNLKFIQWLIKKNEKQLELAKENSEVNKQKLNEINSKQEEINSEIENVKIKLSRYELAKSEVINEFLNSDEFQETVQKLYEFYNKGSEDDKGYQKQKDKK